MKKTLIAATSLLALVAFGAHGADDSSKPADSSAPTMADPAAAAPAAGGDSSMGAPATPAPAAPSGQQ